MTHRKLHLESLEHRQLLAVTLQPAGGELAVNTSTTDYQEQSAVAVENDGDFVVVWSSHDGDGGIYGKMFAGDGSVTKDEFLISNVTEGTQVYPDVAVDPSAGGFVVTWQHDSPPDGDTLGESDIFARAFAADGTAAGDQVQVSAGEGDHFAPSVAFTATGDFVIAWDSFTPSAENNVFARHFTSTNAIGGATFDVSTGAEEFSPDVASAGDGSFIVAWESTDADSSGIAAQRFDSASGAIGTTIAVNTTTGGDQTSPSIAVQSDGSFIIAWLLDTEVVGQLFASDGSTAGSELDVNGTSPARAYTPSSAALNDGGFLVAWTDDGLDVMGRSVESDGTLVGAAIVLNTTTDGDQLASKVGSAANHVVATWTGPDADGDGIFGQAYTTTDPLPTADAGGPYTIPEGSPVTLDGSASTTPTGTTLVSYAWDFDNDGQYDDATGVSPTFTQAIDRIYTVGLLVTNNLGLTASAETTVTVTNVAPTADAGGPYTVDEGAGITLDASASSDPGGDIGSYQWDLDNDGEYDDATGAQPTFSAAGLDGPTTQTVGLKVTDDDGTADTTTVQITVTNVAPTADAGGPYTVDEGASITLDASASSDPGGDIASYQWDLDNDGEYDDATGVQPTFSAAGLDGPTTQTVGLKVTDDDGAADTTTVQITVKNVAPTADAGGPYTVDEGASITLDASASSDPGGDIASYQWDLDNDGEYDDATGAQPTFSAAGLDGPTTQTVGLKVTDDDGAADTTSVQITVKNVAPTADAGGPYTIVEGGGLLLNAASSTDPGNDIASYQWDRDGNGAFEVTGKTTIFSSDEPGTYTVTLRVTDSDGASDDADIQITVTQAPPHDLGEITFNQVEGAYPATKNIWYQVQASQTGFLTIEAVPNTGTAALALYDSERNEPALASSSDVGGVQRLDHQVTIGETYLVRLSGTSNNVDLTLANLVRHEGKEVTVSGTNAEDEFTFTATDPYSVSIKGIDYSFTAAECESITFNGGEGDDTATLTGSSAEEIAHFWPDHGTFGENGFLVNVNDVNTITADGGGGTDEAYLYDSPGDDEFVARKGYANLSGDGFELETIDFPVVHAYAITPDGGTDTAHLEDTAGRDKFKLNWPQEGAHAGKLYGGGTYFFRAKMFETIEATMTGGRDVAVLYGSDGDDVYHGQEALSNMSGPGYEATVSGYYSLIVRASKGNDLAYLEDSEGDDIVRARSHKAILWRGDYRKPEYIITARQFDEYHIECTGGGFDKAKLHDTALADYFEASGSSATFYREQDATNLRYEALAFEWVRIYATPESSQAGSRNTLKKDTPIEFELIYDPDLWDEVL